MQTPASQKSRAIKKDGKNDPISARTPQQETVVRPEKRVVNPQRKITWTETALEGGWLGSGGNQGGWRTATVRKNENLKKGSMSAERSRKTGSQSGARKELYFVPGWDKTKGVL